jgi:hypothetical protein
VLLACRTQIAAQGSVLGMVDAEFRKIYKEDLAKVKARVNQTFMAIIGWHCSCKHANKRARLQGCPRQ